MGALPNFLMHIKDRRVDCGVRSVYRKNRLSHTKTMVMFDFYGGLFIKY